MNIRLIKKHMKVSLVLIVVIGILFLAFMGYLLRDEAQQVGSVYESTERFIQTNQKHLEKILTAGMDQASTCDVSKCARHEYPPEEGKLPSLECFTDCHMKVKALLYRDLVGHETLPQFPSTYFIRLGDDGNIEKLFLSGKFVSETVDTDGERRVVNFLKSGRRYINPVNGLMGEFLRGGRRHLGDMYY